jgi:hypothetical protein
MNNFINSSSVKKFALACAANHKKMSDGTPRFTRVSAEFLENVNAEVMMLVDRKVQQLPSSGRTIN